MANIYCGSVEWTAVAAWAALTGYVSTSNGGRGDYVRQLAGVAVGNERVFRCTTSGTSLSAEPAWTITKNGVTTEVAGPVWTECTGQEADQVSGTWKAPHARLQNAQTTTWEVAGDTVFVAHDHAETQAAAMTLVSKGTIASPCNVICVNSAGTVPPVSADLRVTATITTTGAFALKIDSGGYTYWYGITFNSGSGATNVGLTLLRGGVAYFKNCVLARLGSTAGVIQTNDANNNPIGKLWLDGTSLQFGNTGDQLSIQQTNLNWKNSVAVVGATIPTTLMTFANNSPALAFLDGVDLSALGSGTICGAVTNSDTYYLKDCKLGSGAVVMATPAGPGSAEAMVTRADSAGTNYRHEKYQYMGTQTVETTTVRTSGGASDGTTPISWKIVTTANAKWTLPFESMPVAIWNNTTGANVTVTVEGIASSTFPNNDDLWMEVDYLGASTSPLATTNAANGKADFLAVGVPQASSTVGWNGILTQKFKLVATLSAPQPAQKGTLYVRFKAAKASQTYYIDPLITLS